MLNPSTPRTVQLSRGMKSCFVLLILLALTALPNTRLQAAASGEEVVVIYNQQLPASEDVARHYAAARKVPPQQVIGFKLSIAEEISRAEYNDTLAKPLARELEQRKLWTLGTALWPITGSNDLREVRVPVESKIRYVVLCYGVPLKIAHDPNLQEPGLELAKPELRVNSAAVDSELATLPLPAEVTRRYGLLRNITYTSTNTAMFSPTNALLMVTRLDGPSAAIARSLVDKAMFAETNGFWGRTYFDIRSVTDTNYLLGDEWIRGAYDISRVLGYDALLDTNAATFGAGQPMSHIIFYAGWYEPEPNGPFLAPKLEFMPGAFAYHLHSGNAWTIRSTNRAWVGPLLAKGATCTFGSVNEPYLSGTPDIGTFAARWLISGFTFGEAAYAAQSCLSWQTTVVGDPLYRPFAMNPQLLHIKLEGTKNPLIEWSHVRVVNLNLVKGTPAMQVIAYLENTPLTKQSSVMMEKLGDLNAAVGKPSSSVYAFEKALSLPGSPQQRLRLYLKLAGRHTAQKHPDAAVKTYRDLLAEFADYAGKTEIEAEILKLAPPTSEPTNAIPTIQRALDRMPQVTNTPDSAK